MKNIERFIKALANRRRIEIVRYVYKRKRATVGEISKHLKLSFKSTSKHVCILKSAEIVDGKQVNLSVGYSLSCPKNPIINTIISSSN